MESLKKQVANAEVVSEMEGVVKSINRNNSGSDSTDGGYTDSGYADSDSDENANAYIVLMATGAAALRGYGRPCAFARGRIAYLEGNDLYGGYR